MDLWAALRTVERGEHDFKVSHEGTVERLSIAAEFRDDETANHIKRMSRYCGLLTGWAGFDRERAEMVRTASIMHDVEKIGIPDSILFKPGKLTPDEYRRAFALPDAIKIMKEGRGSHFDPSLLELFMTQLDEVLQEKSEDDRLLVP